MRFQPIFGSPLQPPSSPPPAPSPVERASGRPPVRKRDVLVPLPEAGQRPRTPPGDRRPLPASGPLARDVVAARIADSRLRLRPTRCRHAPIADGGAAARPHVAGPQLESHPRPPNGPPHPMRRGTPSPPFPAAWPPAPPAPGPPRPRPGRRPRPRPQAALNSDAYISYTGLSVAIEYTCRTSSADASRVPVREGQANSFGRISNP